MANIPVSGAVVAFEFKVTQLGEDGFATATGHVGSNSNCRGNIT